MYKYQNISKTTQAVVVSGKVEPSAEVESGREVLVEFPIENPNFKYIGKVEDASEQTPSEIKTQTGENE